MCMTLIPDENLKPLYKCRHSNLCLFPLSKLIVSVEAGIMIQNSKNTKGSSKRQERRRDAFILCLEARTYFGKAMHAAR